MVRAEPNAPVSQTGVMISGIDCDGGWVESFDPAVWVSAPDDFAAAKCSLRAYLNTLPKVRGLNAVFVRLTDDGRQVGEGRPIGLADLGA